MTRPEAVTVRQQRGPSKLLRKIYAENGWTHSPRHWEVRHWGKHIRYFNTQPEAEEYATEYRRKIDRARFEREEKKREADRRYSLHLKQCEAGLYSRQWNMTPPTAPPEELKTAINPLNLQPFLESASNAADKGQAQYFTPEDWATALAEALPRFRPVIVDLTSGQGYLLRGAARPSTTHLCGCDIDAAAGGVTSPQSSQGPASIPIVADLTRLYPLMRSIQFQADLFVLNPPWDLHWHRKHLDGLAKSDLATVRDAFSHYDGRLSRANIDSTIATLAIALDRCSEVGEGLLIANESTLQRLLLGDNAPHKALAQHVWLHLTIAAGALFPIETGVIYFARGHESGLLPAARGAIGSLQEARDICSAAFRNRLDLRDGPDIKPYLKLEGGVEKWQALQAESERLFASQPPPQWNLTLDTDGTIVANLTLFDTHSGRVDKELAQSLFLLHGKEPLQLVMLRQQRKALERAVSGKTYRVDPKLQEAVRDACRQYEAMRAPLYPLSPIQRLGYLDEQDEILCKRTLKAADGHVAFYADHSYKLTSTTVAVKRSGTKVNLRGELDECEWDGQELAFWIVDATGYQRLFMEGRLRSKDVQVSILLPGERPGRSRTPGQPCHIDHTLHDLVDHFEIPAVPDVAAVDPNRYQQNLELLNQIEQLTACL